MNSFLLINFVFKLYPNENDIPSYDVDQLTTRNQQRLKKLRDLEGHLF